MVLPRENGSLPFKTTIRIMNTSKWGKIELKSKKGRELSEEALPEEPVDLRRESSTTTKR